MADPAPDEAFYVLAVRFRLAPAEGRTEPATFETTWFRPAAPPGEEGWLFFRDHCWRGAASDPTHLATLAEDALGVAVETAAFRELRTGREHYEALQAAIAAELDTGHVTFGTADDVPTVLKNYLGSSVHVVEREA